MLARLVAVVLLAPLAAAMAWDASGVITVGAGDARVWPDVDHAFLVAPRSAIGFDLDGPARYEFSRLFNGGGDYYRLLLFSPVGTFDVPWAVRWVEHGNPEVRFEGIHRTTCTGPTCDAVVP